VRLHPRRSLETLSPGQIQDLYASIQGTVAEISAAGGRYDETDLYGRPGGYTRVMDQKATGRPCPGCGGPVEKIQYLGGSCYFCATCQT
jgi:formamidopyrimidine-DNA glycosylase